MYTHVYSCIHEFAYTHVYSCTLMYTHEYSCITLLNVYKISSFPGLVSHISEGLVSHIKMHVRDPVIKYMLLYCNNTSAAFLW